MTLSEAIAFKPHPYVFMCIPKEHERNTDIALIDIEICREFEMDHEKLHSTTRKRTVVVARQVAMYMGRRLTKNTLKDIGEHYGRDHTTVMHSIDTVNNLMDTDKEYRAKVNKLMTMFGKPLTETKHLGTQKEI